MDNIQFYPFSPLQGLDVDFYPLLLVSLSLTIFDALIF